MQKKEVKAVLLDLDGTLVDSYWAWCHIINDTLESLGLNKLTQKEFSKRFGTSVDKDVKYLYLNKMTKGKIIKKYNFYFKKRRNHVKIFRQTIPMLNKLKKAKIKLALITNCSRPIAMDVIKHHKIKKYFDAVVTMNDVKHSKPAPDMIFKACRMLNVGIRDVIFVGDTNNDILAGKNAGCTTVGYKIKGDYMISELNDIQKIIKIVFNE